MGTIPYDGYMGSPWYDRIRTLSCHTRTVQLVFDPLFTNVLANTRFVLIHTYIYTRGENGAFIHLPSTIPEGISLLDSICWTSSESVTSGWAPLWRREPCIRYISIYRLSEFRESRGAEPTSLPRALTPSMEPRVSDLHHKDVSQSVHIHEAHATMLYWYHERQERTSGTVPSSK
jgi:hypothetical protein